MIVGLVLMGVIVGAILSVMVRQQRFYVRVGQAVDMRASFRHALGSLPADLRGSSPESGDIYAMDDKSIEFRAIRGSSVACVIPTVGGPTIIIPPVDLQRGNALTSWLEIPVPGDSVLAYAEGPFVGSDDDTWARYRITAITPVVGACPPASGFTTAADAAPSYNLTLSGGLDSTVVVGSPIRVFRRVRYELYQAADAQWYLGYQECLDAGCSSREAVGGPYRPYSATAGQSGLSLGYEDVAGAATAVPTEVARVAIMARGETPRRSDGSWGRDSLSAIVGIRNRP